MFKKLIVLLAIACVASARQISDQENVGNAIDDLLEKLQEIVNATIAKGREAIIDAEVAINNTATDVETEAASDLKVLSDSFKEKIDEFKEEAKDAGVDIDECLGKDEEELLNLPTVASSDIVKCIQGLLLQIFSTANDTLTKIQGRADEIAEIEEEIKDCGSGLSAIACLAKVTLKIEEDIVKLPEEILKDMDDILETFKNFVPKIKTCSTDGIAYCTAHGAELVNKIGTCVAGKIIH